MSRIVELGDKYKNLPNILDVYAKELESAGKKLEITGKKLELANSENSAWLHYYDQRKVELHALVKFFQAQEDAVRGKLFKSYKETYSRVLSERDINKYIDNEQAYMYVHSLLIEVEEMYEQYQSAVNAFTSRNYALSNITKIRVAQLEYIEI